MKKLLLALFAGFFISVSGQEIIQTRKIWNQAPHNAFTDLVRYKGSFYCVFRESAKHVPAGRSENGQIRILKSRKGDKWESIALLKNEQFDLRDPKISVTPDNRLMVLMGGSDYTTGKLGARVAHVSFSNDGLRFSDPQPTIVDEAVRTDADWIWRVTWFKGTGYGVLYQSNQPDGEFLARVVSTRDGIHYQLVSNLDLKGKPNESTIRFEGDRMYVVVRREAKENNNGMFGFSDPPYQTWKWIDLGIRLGGPEFAFVAPGKIALGTRVYHTAEVSGHKTGVLFMNTDGKSEK
ncbi:MAG: hypothetical protein PHY99_10040, partial [Bacteroidales bacterium]|nr:hypothetical protein [Bacteroidales bacterium]